MENNRDTGGQSAPRDCQALFGSVVRTPLYFRVDEEPLFGWCHIPAHGNSSTTGMVICPPIGYEYMSGHRAMRHLADQFAREGIPAMRFDYHGTGDSAGIDEDPDRVSAWLESIREAIRKIKEISGCTRVGLVGVRIGATLATLIAEEEALECLVLWAPCVNGRHYVREMKFLEQKGGDAVNGDIESAGFVLSAQTVRDISSIKLTKRIPRQGSNILIVARDDLQDDFTLQDRWKEQGLSVSYIRMSGFSDFLTSPHKTKIPLLTTSSIVAWVKDNVDMSKSGIEDPPPTALWSTIIPGRSYVPQQNEMQASGIREKIVRFGREKSLFGILSEPVDQSASAGRPTVLLLNSGAVHHTGTNRLYVLLARHLAQQGISSLRMDIEGLGDSAADNLAEENGLYNLNFVQSVDSAMTYLKKNEGREEFVIAGLCFGSYASFHSTLKLPASGIVECIIINPLVFYWKEGMSLDEPGLAQDLSTFKAYQRSTWQLNSWLKLFRGGVDLHRLVDVYKNQALSALRSALNGVFSDAAPLARDIEQASAAGVHLSFVIADQDPGYELLMLDARKAVKALSRRGVLSIDIIKNSSHTFPLRRSREVVIKQVTDNLKQRYSSR